MILNPEIIIFINRAGGALAPSQLILTACNPKSICKRLRSLNNSMNGVKRSPRKGKYSVVVINRITYKNLLKIPKSKDNPLHRIIALKKTDAMDPKKISMVPIRLRQMLKMTKTHALRTRFELSTRRSLSLK